MSMLTRRDGRTARLARPNSQAPTETGKFVFPCSADHEQDWQHYPVDPYSAICDDHTYIQSRNQPGKVTNPAAARGQLIFPFSPCPRSRLRIWSRHTTSAVPTRVSLLIPHTQAESDVSSRNSAASSRFCVGI